MALPQDETSHSKSTKGNLNIISKRDIARDSLLPRPDGVTLADDIGKTEWLFCFCFLNQDKNDIQTGKVGQTRKSNTDKQEIVRKHLAAQWAHITRQRCITSLRTDIVCHWMSVSDSLSRCVYSLWLQWLSSPGPHLFFLELFLRPLSTLPLSTLPGSASLFLKISLHTTFVMNFPEKPYS